MATLRNLAINTLRAAGTATSLQASATSRSSPSLARSTSWASDLHTHKITGLCNTPDPYPGEFSRWPRVGEASPQPSSRSRRTGLTSRIAGLATAATAISSKAARGRRLPALELTAASGETVDPVATNRAWTVLYCFPGGYAPGGLDYPPGWNAVPGASGCTLESCT